MCEPVQLASDLWVLKLPQLRSGWDGVNAYLFKGESIALIDCGFPSAHCWEQLKAGLGRLRLTIGDIDLFLYTHGHIDHMGMAAYLGETVSRAQHMATSVCAQWCGRYDAYLDHLRTLPKAIRRLGDIPGLDAFGEQAVAWADAYYPAGLADVNITRTLGEGDRIELGRRTYEVRLTPGHDPGHLCLIEPATGEAISGDLIFPYVAPIMPYQRGDFSQYVRSLQRMLQEPLRKCYPGHGEPITGVQATISRVLDRIESQKISVSTYLREQPNGEAPFGAVALRILSNLKRDHVGQQMVRLQHLSGLLELMEREGHLRLARGEDGYTCSLTGSRVN